APRPKPGPTPRPKPLPAPITSKTIMKARSTWAALDVASAARRRRGRGPVVGAESRGVIARRARIEAMDGGNTRQVKRVRTASSPLEPPPRPPPLDPAEGALARALVPHDEFVAPAEPRDDLLHVLQVHQARLVGAEEEGRVEPFL